MKEFYKNHPEAIKRISGKNNHRYGKFGEDASNWLGGLSFEPYTPDFNKKFKKAIRERDNHCCMICNLVILKPIWIELSGQHSFKNY